MGEREVEEERRRVVEVGARATRARGGVMKGGASDAGRERWRGEECSAFQIAPRLAVTVTLRLLLAGFPVGRTNPKIQMNWYLHNILKAHSVLGN